MKIRLLPALLILSLPLLGPSLLQAQTISFKPVARFTYPGAVSTLANGINDSGNVVGGYVLPNQDYASGFERLADGSFASIIVPGSGVYLTYPTAINNQGTVAGWYEADTPFGAHGFFLSGGVYTTFDHPAASGSITHILGLNDAGDFVGVYAADQGIYHAFASIGGQLSEITIPGATYVEADDINNKGDIVGWYNTTQTSSGFRLESDGTLRYPIKPSGNTSAILFGTNETTASVGQENGNFAFYYGGGNTYVTYTFPHLSFNSFTGINQRGVICGYGFDEVAKIDYSYLVRRVVTPAAQ
ncbi:MAG: hypothetical protein H0X40_18705 [Chthoniobacterales bacterium]|nr:hypothetical protein [Chthoniobacterales bacterium]